MSDITDKLNQDAARVAGIDQDEARRFQHLLQNHAMVLVQDFMRYMAETHRVSPASSAATILQVALHSMKHAAPGAPATDWVRARCDVMDCELAGTPPPPEQMARLQALTLAMMQAAKDRASRGRVQ